MFKMGAIGLVLQQLWTHVTVLSHGETDRPNKLSPLPRPDFSKTPVVLRPGFHVFHVPLAELTLCDMTFLTGSDFCALVNRGEIQGDGRKFETLTFDLVSQ